MTLADYQGAALIIAALGVSIPPTVAAVMSVAMFMRQGQEIQAAATRDKKLDVLHELANGNNAKLTTALESVARTEGERTGEARAEARHAEG